MSLRASTRVWESSKMKGGSLLVLLAIADYAVDDGRNAFPSTHTLSWKTRLTFRQVREILVTLQTAGELIVDPKDDDGRRMMHIRCVFENWPAIPKPPKEWNQHPAKNSEARRKSPRGLTPSNGENLRSIGDPPPIPRQPTAGDPLSDPSLNLLQGAGTDSGPVDAVEAVENSLATVRVVTKLVHTILDEHPRLGGVELEEEVKNRCARLRLRDYQHIVPKAVDSALWQRKPRPRTGGTA